MQTSYRLELDVSPDLGPNKASWYQYMIGILIWMVELVRVDIFLEFSMMQSNLALPRKVNLHQVLNIFSHLQKYYDTDLLYDPIYPCIDESSFELHDFTFSEFGHIQGKEYLPPNMSQYRGLGFVMREKLMPIMQAIH